MKKIVSILLIAVIFHSCSNGQTEKVKTNLTATEFSTKIKELPNAPIIDVRTAEEYAKGHLANSLNYDWNGSDFEKQISTLDKSKPVLVYCLSGGRSSAAAQKMRLEGFTTVYEMDGGIMKWRGANLPETTDNAAASKATGMTKEQFETLITGDKIMLVDFYADWCSPCKKMKPYLDEIAKEMSATVQVIRINADDNQNLCKELHVDALPVLQVYKNKELKWTNTGYIDKGPVVEQLK